MRVDPSYARISWVLPSLLIPDMKSAATLREAAARYQSDLLLVYRTSSRTYSQRKWLSPDEARAYCTVEAVLLDTRTGMAPFTAVASEDYIATSSRDDFHRWETAERAELEAIVKAASSIADSLAAFIGSVPPKTAAPARP